MPKRYAELTLDDIATFPPPGAAVPQSVTFLPGGTAVAYLLPREGTTTLDLWRQDLGTIEAELLAAAPGEADASYSLDEQLRRERMRQAWGGITNYQVAGETLLVPHAGRLWHAPLGAELRPLDGADGAIDPRLFPDGRRVAFVLAGELHVADLAGGSILRLTEGSAPGLTHGLAEYAAQEELGRGEGFWVHPDGQVVAFTEVDERHVPLFPITHQAADPVWVEEHRYPFVGQENARVRLGTVSATGGAPTWYEVRGEYLARVVWTKDGDLCALWLDRLQRTAEWVRYHTGDPAAHPIFSETVDPWYNLGDDTTFLAAGEILLSSERSGVRRLYLRSPDGSERCLLEGSGSMTRLLALDEEGRRAFVLGWDEDPTERHIFEVSLGGGQLRRLTHAAGWHQAIFSPDCRLFIDVFSSPDHPPTTLLCRVDDPSETVLHSPQGQGAEDLGLRPPEFITVKAEDGTLLHGAVYSPPTPAEGPLPLIVAVYGGPHAQRVTRAWDLTCDLEAQYLARSGYLVLRLDGRGSYGRGLAFEAALRHRFGTIELDDQVAGVRALVAQGRVLADRVGIYGWSYGGYMTLRALLMRPDIFRAGVAGAPVTDFRWYDTAYTERYMGLPEENGAGYDAAALPALADRLDGKLMIIHGLVDENVHFRHSARMITALVAAGKNFETMLLPESRHMVRGFVWKRKVAAMRLRFLCDNV